MRHPFHVQWGGISQLHHRRPRQTLVQPVLHVHYWQLGRLWFDPMSVSQLSQPWLCHAVVIVSRQPWWRDQMETSSALLAFVNSPHKSQWRGALMFSLICAWINGWVNNREAGDLIRHHAHYEVIVIEAFINRLALGLRHVESRVIWQHLT